MINNLANERQRQRQAEIFKAMTEPGFYPHPVTAIEQRETHISMVFLTGPFAYKIKKPLNLGFLDFTTLENRHSYCSQEVSLNQRLSQGIYLEVADITRQDGHFALAGEGEPVEYAVKMRQLPWECAMISLLREGKITGEDIEKLALTLAQFYNLSPADKYITAFGSWEKIWDNCQENFRQTKEFAGEILDEEMFRIIRDATRSFINKHRDLFNRRQEQGRIRDCHGDLRSGHIYFFKGIQIIDCIEFNDRFRYSDIASDLAFLAMDLEYEGYPQAALDFIKAYITYSKDYELLMLLDFYKCYRAYVRVKVNCFRLKEGDFEAKEKDKLLEKIHCHLKLAYKYALQFDRPALLVVCGLPGSGKTTVANELAQGFSIKVFHSDVIRRELFGLPANQKTDVPFGKGLYAKEARGLTYGKLLLLAREELQRGSSALIDATFSSRDYRHEVLRLAEDMRVNLFFIECTAPDELLKERLLGREKVISLSDARLHHFEEIKAHFEPLDEISEDKLIRANTEMPLEQTLQHIFISCYSLLTRQTPH